MALDSNQIAKCPIWFIFSSSVLGSTRLDHRVRSLLEICEYFERHVLATQREHAHQSLPRLVSSVPPSDFSPKSVLFRCPPNLLRQDIWLWRANSQQTSLIFPVIQIIAIFHCNPQLFKGRRHTFRDNFSWMLRCEGKMEMKKCCRPMGRWHAMNKKAAHTWIRFEFSVDDRFADDDGRVDVHKFDQLVPFVGREQDESETMNQGEWMKQFHKILIGYSSALFLLLRSQPTSTFVSDVSAIHIQIRLRARLIDFFMTKKRKSILQCAFRRLETCINFINAK